jgi:hypothetical protein
MHVLSTPTAVVAGLTYDALPFMALPIHVSLEQIDRALVDAGARRPGPVAASPRWGGSARMRSRSRAGD